jgi:hypothetical protein
LAQAAYARNLIEGNIDREKLINDALFSTVQANYFIQNYRVVTQLPDTLGLSATIFADNLTEETFLAICGTEITDPNDLFAGLSLTIFGTTVLQPQLG